MPGQSRHPHFLALSSSICDNDGHELAGDSLRGLGLLGLGVCLVLSSLWQHVGGSVTDLPRAMAHARKRGDGGKNDRHLRGKSYYRGSDFVHSPSRRAARHEPRAAPWHRGRRGPCRCRADHRAYLGIETNPCLDDRCELSLRRLHSGHGHPLFLALTARVEASI